MFTFSATPVKFVGLLVLFAWCTIWCGYELTRARNRRQRISGALHLGMAVVMVAMIARSVWRPLVGVVPIPALVAIFALATVWFGWLTVTVHRESGLRSARAIAGHTLMFAAMTWHLAAMAVKHALMMGSSGPMGSMGNGGMGGTTGSGQMGAMSVAQASQPGGSLWIAAVVGVPFMIYLLAASVSSLRQVRQPAASRNDDCQCGAGCTCGRDCACAASHQERPVHRVAELALAGAASLPAIDVPASQERASCHAVRPVGTMGYRLAALSDVAMNFGMFWMSTGLLVPLLPILAKLAF